jgi:hypothetical protein
MLSLDSTISCRDVCWNCVGGASKAGKNSIYVVVMSLARDLISLYVRHDTLMERCTSGLVFKNRKACLLQPESEGSHGSLQP